MIIMIDADGNLASYDTTEEMEKEYQIVDKEYLSQCSVFEVKSILEVFPEGNTKEVIKMSGYLTDFNVEYKE